MSTLILFGSEIALSLYPQLIKQLQTQIDIQIAIRLITYSFVALLGIFYYILLYFIIFYYILLFYKYKN
jgi:hypothetical protein